MDGISDVDDFKHVKRAMATIGIPEPQQKDIFKLLAAILHLGSIFILFRSMFFHELIAVRFYPAYRFISDLHEQRKRDHGE